MLISGVQIQVQYKVGLCFLEAPTKTNPLNDSDRF